MRHRNSRLRLKQKPQHGRMMERNLLTSVLLYESIRTTKKRAKVLQPLIDGIISKAKKNTPHVAIRAINKVVMDKNACRKIMEVYCERYKERNSGLSRIIPVGARRGDGAEVVDLVLMDMGNENNEINESNERSKISERSKINEENKEKKDTSSPKKKPSKL